MTDTKLASDEGSGGVNKPKPFSDKSSYDIDMDTYLTISWDKVSEEVLFQVEMPADSYLAIAFGRSLEKCDMILFQSDMETP